MHSARLFFVNRLSKVTYFFSAFLMALFLLPSMAAASSLVVNTPPAGAVRAGQFYDLTWTPPDGSGPWAEIRILKNGTELEYYDSECPNPADPSHNIFLCNIWTLPNSGTFRWAVPDSYSGSGYQFSVWVPKFNPSSNLAAQWIKVDSGTFSIAPSSTSNATIAAPAITAPVSGAAISLSSSFTMRANTVPGAAYYYFRLRLRDASTGSYYTVWESYPLQTPIYTLTPQQMAGITDLSAGSYRLVVGAHFTNRTGGGIEQSGVPVSFTGTKLATKDIRVTNPGFENMFSMTPYAGQLLNITGNIVNSSGREIIPGVFRVCVDNVNCATSTTGRIGTDYYTQYIEPTMSISLRGDSLQWTAAQGTHTITVCADITNTSAETNEANNCATSPQFTVTSAPTITLTSPTAGQQLISGLPTTLTWTSQQTLPTDQVSIELHKPGVVGTNIRLGAPNNGSYTWTVAPLMQNGSPVYGSDYSIKLVDVRNTGVPVVIASSTSALFSIVPPGVTISDPSTGTRVREGKAYTLRWSSAGLLATDQLNLVLKKVGENRTDNITTTLNPLLGSYVWTPVPLRNSGNVSVFGNDYFITAYVLRGGTIVASFDTPKFTFEQRRQITVTTPQNVFADTFTTIQWSSVAVPSTVSIRVVNALGQVVASGGLSQSFGQVCLSALGTTCASETPEANDGTFTWSVPADLAGAGYKVFVFDDTEPSVTLGSSQAFSIGAAMDRYDLNNDTRTDHLDRAIIQNRFAGQPCAAIAPRTCDLDRNGTSGDIVDVQAMTNRLIALYDYTSDGVNDIPDGALTQKDIDWFSRRILTNNLVCPAGKRCDITMDGQAFKAGDLSLLGLIVGVPPKLTITQPNNGETLYTSTAYQIQWATEGAVPEVVVLLLQGGVVKYQIAGSIVAFGGAVVTPYPNSGSAVWSVPANALPGEYDLLVQGDPSTFDYADQKIKIAIPHVDPIAPTAGKYCETAKQCVISWAPTTNGALASDKIRLSLIHGASSLPIGDVNNNGSYAWTVVPIASAYATDYKIGYDVVRNSVVIAGSHTEGPLFEVAEARTISIAAPTANAQVERGKQSIIRWTTTGAVGPVAITIKKGNAVILTTGTTTGGQYVWDIPNTQTLGADYSVRIVSVADATVYALSNLFSIVPKPAISVTSPNGAEVWAIDDGNANVSGGASARKITWKKEGNVGPFVSIQLKDGDAIIGTIAESTDNGGEYKKDGSEWKIVQPFVVPSENAKVVITDLTTGVSDESDSAFTIKPAPIKLKITNVLFPDNKTPTLTINDRKPESVSPFTISVENQSSRPVSNLQVVAKITQGTGASAASHIAMDPVLLNCGPQFENGTLPAGNYPAKYICVSADPGLVIHAADSDQIGGFGTFVEGTAQAEFQIMHDNVVVSALPLVKKTVRLVPKPEIIVVTPNGGEEWMLGGKIVAGSETPQKYEIKWRSRGLVGPVDIDLRKSDNYVHCTGACDANGDGVVNAADDALVAEFQKYDVTGDGRVDREDLDLIQSLDFGNSSLACPAGRVCDVNGDGGSPDVADLTSINAYILSLYDLNGDRSIDDDDVDVIRDVVLGDKPCPNGKMCDFNFSGGPGVGDIVTLINYINYDQYSRGVAAYYDINNDGKVNQDDIEFLTKIVAGTESCPNFTNSDNPARRKTCSLDGNPGVDGNDVTILKNFITSSATSAGEGRIATNVPNTNTGPQASQGGKFLWDVKNPFVRSGDDYKIVIREHARPEDIFDDSDAVFSIVVPPPKIISPKASDTFTIEPKLSMKIDATHVMGLTRYHVRLIQNNKTVYDTGVNTPITLPITINRYTCAKADGQALYGADGNLVTDLTVCLANGGHRLLDVLREGSAGAGLRIQVEGALLDDTTREVYEYTPAAVRTVGLKLNRVGPTIQSPTANQEIALAGKVGILITATHPSQPAFYDIILKQNGKILYEADDIEATVVGNLETRLTKDTQSGTEQLFKKFDKGQVELAVRATLIGGEHTNYTYRIFRVVPLPADFDLNDDNEINTDDFQILQGVVIYESKSERVKPEAQRSGRPCPKLKRDEQGNPVETLIGGKPLKFDKNCNLNGDKDPSGRDIIDSLDLAAMKANPAFEDNTQTFGRIPGGGVTVPNVGSPVAGAVWGVGSPEDVIIQPFPGATGYLVGFVKGGALKFENYRDLNRSLATEESGGNRVFRVPAANKAVFVAGNDWQVWVRALVSNQWTDAAVIPINIVAGGTGGSTQATIGGGTLTVVSPQPNEQWISSSPQGIEIQSVSGATAYNIKASPCCSSVPLNIMLSADSLSNDGGNNLSYDFSISQMNQLIGVQYIEINALSAVGGSVLASKQVPIQVHR